MQEFEWHIMVPICVFGMSYALLHGEHVRVDVVFQYFTPRNKLLVEVITSIAGMLLSIIVIYLCIPYVWQSWSIGEGTANPGGIEYRYIVKALIPIGFALFFLQSLSQAIKSYHRDAERLMFSYEVLAVLMLVSFFVLLLSGIPVALTLAISGFVFGYLGFGSLLFNLLAASPVRRGHEFHAAGDPACSSSWG